MPRREKKSADACLIQVRTRRSFKWRARPRDQITFFRAFSIRVASRDNGQGCLNKMTEALHSDRETWVPNEKTSVCLSAVCSEHRQHKAYCRSSSVRSQDVYSYTVGTFLVLNIIVVLQKDFFVITRNVGNQYHFLSFEMNQWIMSSVSNSFCLERVLWSCSVR